MQITNPNLKCPQCKKSGWLVDKEFIFNIEHCDCVLNVLETICSTERCEEIRASIMKAHKNPKLHVHVRLTKDSLIMDSDDIPNYEFDHQEGEVNEPPESLLWDPRLQIVINESTELTALGTPKTRIVTGGGARQGGTRAQSEYIKKKQKSEAQHQFTGRNCKQSRPTT